MFEPIKPREPIQITVSNVDEKVFQRIIEFIDSTKKMPELIMTETHHDIEKNVRSFQFYIVC